MNFRSLFSVLALFGGLAAAASGQSTATLTGTVTDPTGAVIPGAQIVLRALSTGAERTVTSDRAGDYNVPSLQPGAYSVTASAPGFASFLVKSLIMQVDQNQSLTIPLALASAGETIEVGGSETLIDAASITVGQVIDKETVQEIPLNGRHFLDLTSLTPGGVIAPANGNLTSPSRGVGAFSFDTAGNREDSVNFQINGINLNDINNAQIVFQPSINTTSEVKIDNSTFSAEYGRNSGSIVNVSTRSGTSQFHGEAFDYLRNNSFDARNFFNPRGTNQAALKRNNFGAAVGGPLWRRKAFFFASYEGLRQHQGLPINATVLTAAQRAGVTDPVSLQLLQFIPAANVGTNLYTSSINGPISIDQGTIDLLDYLNAKDTLHGFYAYQYDVRTEPTLQGDSLPGFGDHRPGHRQILTFNETHIFSPRLVNEFRVGYNRVAIKFLNNFTANPDTFGYNNYPAGQTPTGGIPFTFVSTTSIAIGGPGGFPSGRYDTLGVFSDTATYTVGRHTIKFGGEGRRYDNSNFADDPGSVTFGPTSQIDNANGVGVYRPAQSAIQNFQQGYATAFSITPQPTTSRIYGDSVGAFATDNFRITPTLTLELGFRFEWNGTPHFGNDQASVFDAATVTLGKVGSPGYAMAYTQNYNYMPRLGFTYDVFGNGQTELRGGYSILSDQPLSGLVTGLSSNPPYTTKVSYTASDGATCNLGAANCYPGIAQENLYAAAAASSISVNAVQPDYKNATTQSFSFDLQQLLPLHSAFLLGYYGSLGRHLRMTENINQIFPATGQRAFTALSPNSPIDPGASLNGNVSENSSNGTSDYNGMWASLKSNVGSSLELLLNYQWTKSMDLGSLFFTQFTDITQPRLNYGLSDFDTRNRVSGNVVYHLPFRGNRLVQGYQVSGILQYQTGNPLNIVTASTYTGTFGVQHPNLLGPIPYAKRYVNNSVDWFAPGGTTGTPGGLVCGSNNVTPGCIFDAPTTGFGSMQRNGATGPGFADVDASFAKETFITGSVAFTLRADVFDVANHPNFGNPGTVATPGSAAFGVITSTRFPVGDAGSSRQMQFSAKVSF